ncbi:MAG TPA: chromate transporter [Aliidongia sp.]|uniref:chromate transporter n=1 Tax=Aliidongia sp. TaxID=1914230 RepID=UPI002DDCDC3A|nr:chromate transporter [Aliidongia sp.]HEV2673404.1 chromate transporter [Aliidongia sp.]
MTGAPMTENQTVADEVTARDLFLGFLKVGTQGFGGVLPWARRMIVEERHWLSEVDFTDLLSLCQLLPGPNIVNVSVAIGNRFAGPLGALAAVTGLMAAPFAIVLALGMLYAAYGTSEALGSVFRDLGAAAAGLVLATAWKVAKPYVRRPEAMIVAALAFVAVVIFSWPLLYVVLVLAPLSVAWAWRLAR